MYIVKTTSNSYLIGQANNQSDVPNGPIRRGLFKPQSIRLNLMNHFFSLHVPYQPTQPPTHPFEKKNTHAYAPDTNQLQSIPILNEPTPAPKHVANIYYCSLICLRTSAYANCLQLKSNVTRLFCRLI